MSVWKDAKAAARDWAGLPTKALYDAVKRGDLRAARTGASGRRLRFCEKWIDEWLTTSSARRTIRSSKVDDSAA
jgi:hypothetical protein